MALTILLVEDNENDVLLVRRALGRQTDVVVEIRVVRDGAEALDYLYRREGYRPADLSPRPDLILLDINLPKVDGHEVLRTVKQDPELLTIPVVMLTTSRDEEDILESYRHSANGYITKALNFSEFCVSLEVLVRYWGRICCLP